MGVDLRRPHVTVPEQLLDRANVVACFQQMRDGLLRLRHRPVSLLLMLPGRPANVLILATGSEEYGRSTMGLPASLILI